MKNGTKHKMMPLLLPFMTCVLSRLFCQMKWQMCRSWDCSDLFLYPDYTTRGLTGQLIPIPYPIYIEKKIQDLEQELPSLLQSYELRGKQPFISDFSRLLRHAIEKGRGSILYSKKNPGPHREIKVIKPRAVTQCDVITPPSALTDISIYFVLTHTDRHMGGWTDRLISEYP